MGDGVAGLRMLVQLSRRSRRSTTSGGSDHDHDHAATQSTSPAKSSARLRRRWRHPPGSRLSPWCSRLRSHRLCRPANCSTCRHSPIIRPPIASASGGRRAAAAKVRPCTGTAGRALTLRRGVRPGRARSAAAGKRGQENSTGAVVAASDPGVHPAGLFADAVLDEVGLRQVAVQKSASILRRVRNADF